MYVIGGQAPKALKGVERYDHEINAWTDVCPMTSRRCRAGKQYIYLLACLNALYRFCTSFMILLLLFFDLSIAHFSIAVSG